MPPRVLHQFPISHYCEKSRWHLDFKRLPYATKNLLPGVHRVVHRRMGAPGTVPLLVDGDRVVGDSTDIAVYLEDEYPERPLVPQDPALRSRCLELEAYFDETFGPAVRRWIYGHALDERGRVRELFFAGYGGLSGALGRPLLGGVLERTIRRMYRIDAASMERSSRKIDEAVERLESMIGGDPTRYLVGNALTLADVTAAALLAPLVGPEGSPWPDPLPGLEAVHARRAALRERAAGRWVRERYARDRPAP